MAVEMGNEVELQSRMLEEVETKVDKTNAHLKNLNKRMKDTLNKVLSFFALLITGSIS